MEQILNRGGATRALKIALAITTVFMVVEFIGGIWTNSLALQADAGHMLTDVAALSLSLFAIWFGRRPSTPQQTYGFFRVEILAALLNGVLLVGISALVFYESYSRFLQPQEIKTREMILIGLAGLGANLVTAYVLHGSHKHSLNVRGAFLHVIGDLLGSVAVVTAGVAIAVWAAYWADPLVSVFVSILILVSAWRLVKDSVLILLEGTPSHVNLQAMKQALALVPGVISIHDLHVWTLTSGVHVMTCHAVVAEGTDRTVVLTQLSAVSRERFGVHHTTIQLEDSDLCSDSPHACC
jgi:cobalt-zinc-cadmium efflux system protein